MPVVGLRRLIPFSLLIVVSSVQVRAQFAVADATERPDGPASPHEAMPDSAGGDSPSVSMDDVELPATIHLYAGKYEPRIGTWLLSADDKLQLDIGTSVPLLERAKKGTGAGDSVGAENGYTLSTGADFFTWTRLRSVGRFKFPVETVDYYFGLYGAFQPHSGFDRFIPDVRLRLAHISAHLVDGDPRLSGGGHPEITYSREFVDLLVGQSMHRRDASARWYAGGVWAFSSIPSSIGRVVPYAGFDYARELTVDFPMTLRFGYEFRLNSELETIGENLARLGLKFASVYDNGVVMELAYYAGRSPHGQLYDGREEHFSFGFSVEH